MNLCYNTNMNQDQLIYDNAKKRVNRNHWFVFLIVLIYFITIYLIFQSYFIQKTQFPIQKIMVASFISEICLYGLLFSCLSFGKKIFRSLYWIGILYSFCMMGIPVYYIFNDYFHILPYLVWVIALFIKNIGLIHYGKYLKTNRWTKIVFDHEIEIEEDQDIENIYLETNQKEKEEPFTLPQLCLRLGISIYGSLLVFPIFMQIFSSLFASNDLQNVFATKAMFIFCIYTAVIWTIPLFCFYFNQPNSKKVVYICILLELVRILVYSKTLYSYYIQNIYPVRVFIFFILADLIRYIFLLISIKPILTNNVSD